MEIFQGTQKKVWLYSQKIFTKPVFTQMASKLRDYCQVYCFKYSYIVLTLCWVQWVVSRLSPGVSEDSWTFLNFPRLYCFESLCVVWCAAPTGSVHNDWHPVAPPVLWTVGYAISLYSVYMLVAVFCSGTSSVCCWRGDGPCWVSTHRAALLMLF